MAKATMYFPPDFKWGCATAAHQVEGNNTNNDWWAWEHADSHIRNNDKSGLACDWWGDGFERDMDFAAQMHHTAHRLSIEWSRIEPKEGQWDTAAIDRYRMMLQAMRARGIEPMITLHHFSSPLWLVEKGGWETEAVVPLFERFATKAVEAFKDLCDLWVTINEPNVYAVLGYLHAEEDLSDYPTPSGDFPPGKNDLSLAMAVIDNMTLGHAAAYHAIHRIQDTARVGLAHHYRLFDPARSASPLDRFVAHNRDRVFNQTILQAPLTGKIMRPFGLARRVRVVRGTSDFIGLNYYTRELIRFDTQPREAMWMGRSVLNPKAEMSKLNYSEIYPRGFWRTLKRLGQIGQPIYITENGLPDADDDQRPGFLINYLRMMWLAINQNIPIMGYYHWTLTDNFEWAEGWNMRFGLVELNPATQERRLRRSGELYGEICKRNLIDDALVYEYTPELVDTLFPG
jgi:beta-glucosidase